MRNHLCSIFFFLFSFSLFSQIEFEPGYLLLESGEKKQVLIKHTDWTINPESVLYKEHENAEVSRITFKELYEIGVGTHSKFIKATVAVDRKSAEVKNLAADREPEYTRETVMLRVLTEGESYSLYQYRDTNLYKYYFRNPEGEFVDLVHVLYLGDKGVVKNYNHFRQQLFNTLKCDDLSGKDFSNIAYNESALKKVFQKYYDCKNETYTRYEKQKPKLTFSVTALAGMRQGNIKAENSDKYISSFTKGDLGNYSHFSFGADLEAYMPFHKNKWAVTFMPVYTSYEGEVTNNERELRVKYSTVEMAFGVRHYFYLSDVSRIFLTTAVCFDLPVGEKEFFVEYAVAQREIDADPHMMFGAGFAYKDFRAEFRYSAKKDLIKTINWEVMYGSFGVYLGYTIF